MSSQNIVQFLQLTLWLSVLGWHSESVVNYLQGNGDKYQKPTLYFFYPIVVAITQGSFAIWSGAGTKVATMSSLYFLLPALVLYPKINEPGKVSYQDWLALFLITLPLVFLGKRFGGKIEQPLIYIGAIMEGIYLWRVTKNLADMKITFKAGLKEWLFSIGIGFGLVAVLVIPGVMLNFVKWNDAMSTDHSITKAFLAFASFNFLGIFINKLLFTAFGEEVLFRSLFQNMLSKSLKSDKWGWITASVIFGLTHIGHGAHGLHLNWMYGIFAGVASLAYGYVYMRTRSIWCAAIPHAILDGTVLLMFVMVKL